MLNIKKTSKGAVLEIALSGSIDENANFEAGIGAVSESEVQVNCREVPRINSVGVKGWIKFFSALQQSGKKLVFKECSTSIVEQMNLISNFKCNGTVESIFVPFTCEDCGAELVGLFPTAQIKKSNFEIQNLKCNKCGSANAVFDDIKEEYFHFLMD